MPDHGGGLFQAKGEAEITRKERGVLFKTALTILPESLKVGRQRGGACLDSRIENVLVRTEGRLGGILGRAQNQEVTWRE